MFSFYVMESINNPFLDPITNPIGSRIELKGRVFEVVEEAGCDGCFFYRKGQIHICSRDYHYKYNARGGMTHTEAHSLARCCNELRTDKKSIIFKLIKQTENNEQEIK